MSTAHTTGLPGASSASGSNHNRSAATASSTTSTGLSFAVSFAEITHAGSQTEGSDATSNTSTVVLGDCVRAMTFAPAAARDTRSRVSIFAGVRSTFLALFNVNAVSLCSEVTTLPVSVAYNVAAVSGRTGGSSRTGS